MKVLHHACRGRVRITFSLRDAKRLNKYKPRYRSRRGTPPRRTKNMDIGPLRGIVDVETCNLNKVWPHAACPCRNADLPQFVPDSETPVSGNPFQVNVEWIATAQPTPVAGWCASSGIRPATGSSRYSLIRRCATRHRQAFRLQEASMQVALQQQSSRNPAEARPRLVV